MSRASLITMAVSGDSPEAMRADEDQLVRRCQDGDVQVFNLLVERYQCSVYALCYGMLGDADAAADAAQDAFLSAYRNIRRKRDRSFAAWLFRIAINRCYDQLRARGRYRQISLDALDQDGDGLPRQLAARSETPEEQALRNELACEIRRGLHDLPADQRLAVILSDIQGYSHDEIVAATGWPRGTVKSRLSRGRMRLRGVLRAASPYRPVMRPDCVARSPGALLQPSEVSTRDQ